ncbi:MAG: glycosyltransferase family 4 protein [Candidatus Gottesmanbacteria bacterium]|nr:glycosyltransferase family 4 protein [Candidatus Gottesmanbacteria bacterium]
MKILFVSAVLPYPLHSGGQIRIYNLLKRLSKNHDIHLFSFIRENSEKKYLPELSFCSSVVTVQRGRGLQPKYILKALTSSYPLLWSTYHNSEMLALLSDEVAKGKYDLVHIEPGYVWPSIPGEHRIPIVVAEHNIEHAVYESFVKAFRIGILRPFLMRDVIKMKTWQRHVWERATRIITVSESDKTFIQQPNVSVVPNGVDTKLFAFSPKKTMGKAVTFLYVGNFRWMENRDAAEHIIRDFWPAIRKAYPDARLRIVGKNAPKGQYFVGMVDSIQAELHGADIMLAPIRVGGGTKYKILEAMASGLPVITSSLGIAGMSGTGKKHFLIAESADDVLESIAYLRNGNRREEIVTNARALIEKEYSWDMIAQQLNDIWNSL